MPEVYELSQGLSDAVCAYILLYGGLEYPPGTYGRGISESDAKEIMNALKKITPNPQ